MWRVCAVLFSELPGQMKLVIQSSAIRAALLEADRDDGEESDKPMTREEMKARAVAQMAKPASQVRRSGCAGHNWACGLINARCCWPARSR